MIPLVEHFYFHSFYTLFERVQTATLTLSFLQQNAQKTLFFMEQK
jgi:hypothetical protein